jgi:outer membrane biosynthesis protein TonB
VRIGITTSAVIHAAIIAWVLVRWDLSRPFDETSTPAVEVDLVTPKEMPKVPQEERPKPVEDAKPQPSPAPNKLQPSPAPKTEAAAVESAAAATKDIEQAETAARLAEMAQLPIPISRARGDLPASNDAAKLAGDTIAAFKAHLSKCWSALPAEAAATAMTVTIRIALKRNGELSGEPTLLQATASPIGPILVQRAMQALRQCQPYGFLPADRYKEWKVLDLRFSPQGLSGV